MRVHLVAGVVVLAACSTRVMQDRAPAQPTVTFPEAWAEGAEEKPEPASDKAEDETGDADKAQAPAEEGAAGPITHLCCASAKAADKGSELEGCKVIEGGAAAQNECLEAGKTFKACEDAECSQGGCRCSN